MRRLDAMWLEVVCLCEMATMLMFLNYTAILPIVQREWGMRYGQAGLIFSAYQACYLLAASLIQRGIAVVEASSFGATWTAVVLVIGSVSNVAGGWLSDRWGRARLIVLSQLCSACFSLSIGWFFHAPLWFIMTVAAFYNVFATSDSGALSTGVTELAEPSLLGATLALQSCLGFLAAAIAPGAAGFVLDLLQVGSGGTAATSPWQWGPTFGVLGLGVLMGPLSMLALRRAQAAATGAFARSV